MNKFENIRVLITGASSGIGAEFAKQLAKLGASLLLVARREDLLLKLQAELIAAGAKKVEYLVADLTNPTDLANLVTRINIEQIDLLINNAGKGSFGYFETLALGDELNQINLNIVAPVTLAHAVIPQMKARKFGAIISVSSIAAFQPLPLMATYAATKSFNFMHAIALREELRPFGVKVLTLCPGPTATEFGGVARVPGTISGIARDDVQMVVSKTLRALAGNSAFVVTGTRSFWMSLMSRLLPKSLTSRLVANGLRKTLAQANLP